MTQLVALTGRAGAGKDTAADYLVHAHGHARLAFADPIRAMLLALFRYAGIEEEWMTDRALKEQPIEGLGVSYRQLAQTLGTEWGRSVLEDLWIRIATRRLAVLERQQPGVRVVITDCRFPNEAQWVEVNGGAIWNIDRDVPAVRAHESEQHALPCDAVIDNNNSIPALWAQLDALVTEK